ncbi:MAG: dihydropteroate synthase [Dinoroseobacter sp.]|nr:dihydropteroate synthase [Dinoroseobacter sp.]
MQANGLQIIGENFNATRRVKATSPRIIEEDGRAALKYIGLDGQEAYLDVTSVYPEDKSQRRKTQITHIAQAMRIKDMEYLNWIVMAQARAGATIIDVCIDEIAIDPAERHDWMKWIIPLVQQMTDLPLAIDSSDPQTIEAGLSVYDRDHSRPAINSVNLEEGRGDLIPMAAKHNALLFANASGRESMPNNAEERVENLNQIMAMMDAENIPVTDRYLDPLAFPVGAGGDFAKHYLDAVAMIRKEYPEVHIFGGHSNTSFGLPQRKVINEAFCILSVIAGCDTLMIDPVLNSPEVFNRFHLANEALMGRDEMCMNYITAHR